MTFIDEHIPLLDEFRALDSDTNTFRGRTLTREQLIAAGATRLIVRSTTKVNAALLEGTRVRFVGSATAGVDHIDLDFLSSRNIEFSFAPGSNADAVANYVREALSYVPRDVGSSIVPRDDSSSLFPLTVLVVGIGHVGSRVVRIAESLGMNVLESDPPLGISTPLEELLPQADILTLHVPLTTSGPYPTHRMIDEAQIAMLKRGAMVINTSRGDVVNERALVHAHVKGQITAVLDVFENEPNISRETVEAVELLTPHIAGYTYEAKVSGALAILEAMSADDRSTTSNPSEILHVQPAPDRKRLEVIAKRFKEEWLLSPISETFDRIRQESLDL